MEEVEKVSDDLKKTESQKSVTTSNVYSCDFSDSNSEINVSSDKNTYVIAIDDSDDSEVFPLHGNESVIDLKDVQKPQNNEDIYNVPIKNNKSVSTSLHKYVFVAQESFTQTSKTIMELAKADRNENYNRNTHETQTSLISITENKTIEYKVEISSSKSNLNCTNYSCSENQSGKYKHNVLEDCSSKFQESDYEKNEFVTSDSEKLVYEEDILVSNEEQYENTSDYITDSDVEEDSLMVYKKHKTDRNSGSDSSEIPKSVENDIDELYTKLTEHLGNQSHSVESCEKHVKQTGVLTPLTEESTVIKDSTAHSTSKERTSTNNDKDVIFTNSDGMKIKLLPDYECKEEIKLPPIKRDHLYLKKLFTTDSNNCYTNLTTLDETSTQEDMENLIDRWEIRNKDFASGEGYTGNARNEFTNRIERSNDFQLPPITGEDSKPHINVESQSAHRRDVSPTKLNHGPISIKSKIRELKTSSRTSKRQFASTSESRSLSPGTISPDESKLCDLAERGCEALCGEILRRLHSSAWLEIVETLEEMPKVFEMHWNVITEQRIADLIRQVSCHVESPRTQVARSACNTLASILKKTNYTKKPDFYEAITILLSKTGSYSRPVRRAANVALDEIVCSVDFTQAITALCIHGTRLEVAPPYFFELSARSHKSALVRCAASRLLVVACALAGGGRGLLRSRPPTAAYARKYTLRSLAALLDDKNTETRKYAERLYMILRPLANFEAYYLSDVDVELATRQMKKYDLLLGGGKKR